MNCGSRKTIAGLAFLAVSLGSTGCSFFISQPPPRDHLRRPALVCSTNRAPMIADGLLASVLIYAAIRETPTGLERADGAILGVAAAGSAVHGFVSAEECTEAQQAWLKREAVNAAIPRQVPTPPPPAPAVPPPTTKAP